MLIFAKYYEKGLLNIGENLGNSPHKNSIYGNINRLRVNAKTLASDTLLR